VGSNHSTSLLITRTIKNVRFEWHDAKAEANLRLHKISFDLAKTAFRDIHAIEWLDEREDYGEQRFVMLGMADGGLLLYVAYTEREEVIRIISARTVIQYEQDEYFRLNSK
jgi:uncharacterized protein